MDFPADVSTNVFVVDHVETINWSQWGWTNRQSSKQFNDEHDEELAIVAVAYKLRENSSHIYWDSIEQQIWHFLPTVSTTRDKSDQILAHYGFSKLSHGALNATDLESDRPVYLNPEIESSQSLSSGSVGNHPPFGRTVAQVKNIYDKAMVAISHTFSFHLATFDDWMALGAFTCIRMLDLTKEPSEQNWLNACGGRTEKISFSSQWDTKGHLTILSSYSQSERLCTVAHHMRDANHVLDAGTPVLLSPSGVLAKYYGILNSAKERMSLHDLNILKIRCATYLSHEGHFVSPDADWVLFEVPSSFVSSQDRDPQGEHPSLAVWPAEYTFSEVTQVLESAEMSELSEIVDPVARAESWYMGRVARAKEAEAAQKEVELEAQQQLPQNMSDAEIQSDIASPPFRDIVPQDVSGIYPTPPDGLLSQLGETPVSNAQQEASPNFALVDQSIEIYSNPDYHNARSDDLFEDMDMDMVEDADFNFFDEPEIESERGVEPTRDLQVGRDANGGRIGDTSPTPLKESFPADKRATQENPEIETVQEEIMDPSAGGYVEEMIPIQDDKESPLKANIPLVELLSTGPSANGVPEESNTQHLLPYAGKGDGSMLLQRGFFNSVHPGKLDIDCKYSDNGRFGYPLGMSPRFSPSKVDEQKKDREIPQIGLKESGISSPDSNQDDDDVDYDPGTTDNLPSNIFGYDISNDLREMSESTLREQKGATTSHSAAPSSPESISSQLDHDLDGAFSPFAFFNSVASYASRQSTLGTSAPRKLPYTSDDRSFIEVAQILADQIARVNLHSPIWSKPSDLGTQAGPSCHKLVMSVVSGIFPSVAALSLLDLVDASDEAPGKSQNIYKLDSSPVRVRRMGVMTDILAAAFPFWEGLSLCPSSGPKDVYAFCIFPKVHYLVPSSKTFLEMMKGAYQTCNLGRHDHDGSQSAYPYGLVPVPVNVADSKASFAKFGKHLAGLRLRGGNYIIYMLNTSEDDGAIPGLCSAFLNLFWLYCMAHEDVGVKNPNDLVLQIVPSSMVFSRNKLVLPSPGDYKRLALQVYDRCSPNNGEGQDQMPPFACAPAIRLSKPVPKVIDFKLATNPPSALLDSDSCLHLAYKWEHDQQWLAASWTNSLGTLQWNAAYWLSKDLDIQHSFPQAAAAMLDVTNEMLQPLRASCKLYLVKNGLFNDHEVETWRRVKSQKAKYLDIFLLEIDSSPPLELIPPRLPHVVLDTPDLLATPVSTPNTTGQSPDGSSHILNLGNSGAQVAQPASSAENDPDARLIDITDETWGAIVNDAGVQTSANAAEPNAKAQGYLIKRAGTGDDDGFLPVQVTIVHGSKPRQPVLKEILSMYRDLAALARVRNVIDAIKGTLPIHVAAARKVHTALCRSMRYAG